MHPTPEQLAEALKTHSRADDLMAQAKVRQEQVEASWPSCWDCGVKMNPDTIWGKGDECRSCFRDRAGPFHEDEHEDDFGGDDEQ